MKRPENHQSWSLFRTLSILCSTWLIVSMGQAQDITTGLKLHYTFDAINGTTIPDDSGNSNTGSLQGTAAAVSGYSGQGIQCMVKADYIGAPANINSGLSSFTFATWVKFSALKNASRFFDWGTGADATNNFLAFIPSYGSDNGFMTLRYRPVSGTAYNVTSTSKCPVGSWAHVAVTYSWNASVSVGTATIYLNGDRVGSTDNLPFNPATSLGSTSNNYFGYSRWNQDTNGFNGIFDDIRIYNRALTRDDILSLCGLEELYKQYDSLTLGNISQLTDNILLPTTLGSKGVTASWASSNPSVMDALGVVTRPSQYDRCVTLSALLSMELNGVVYSKTKEFVATVKGQVELPEHICKWDFDPESIIQNGSIIEVKDRTINQYTATLKNDARIRTIGNTNQINVLDLGNGSGYLDMGEAVGEAIYSLKDHTIMGYFRIHEDYSELTLNGNFLYAFSNTPQADVDASGYLIGRLNNTSHQCTRYNWNNGKMEIASGSAAARGSWHHFAYVQDNLIGRIYIDGTMVKEAAMTQLPAIDIALPDRTGTRYNWLGRSIGQITDVFLRQTLLYDFNVYSKALNSDSLIHNKAVTATLSALNSAYAENPDYKAPGLQSECDQLTLDNLEFVTEDLPLPVQGKLDPAISITWESSCESIISRTGEVNRPKYFDFPVTLTATLTSGIYTMTKTFHATVLLSEGSQYQDDLLVRFDFSNLSGNQVQDVAEKHLTGLLMNQAKIRTIGNEHTGIYNILYLGENNGYFDMGTEAGNLLYHLNDYTMSAYYRIDESYSGLSSAGNFIWNFSNTSDAMNNPNGYIIGSLTNLSHSITPGNYTSASGNQTVDFSKSALKGSWHHIAYTQKGNTGVLYLDGNAVMTQTVTNLPKNVLLKKNLTGTLYNWLGRSCYPNDAYLKNTCIYDFRLYKKALTNEEIVNTEFNVAETIAQLDAACRAYMGTEKTGETQVHDVSRHPGTSILRINKTDLQADDFRLTDLRKISFVSADLQLNLKNGNSPLIPAESIKNMIFIELPTDYPSQEREYSWILYPNPAQDEITVSHSNQVDTVLWIYSSAGQLVMREVISANPQRIDIGKLPQGIYLIKVGDHTIKLNKK